MADEFALQDQNQVFSLLAASGTADSDDTVRVTSKNTRGALDVYNVGPGGTVTVGSISTIGTVSTITGGTVVAWDNLAKFAFDNIAMAYPDGTTETYTYKAGTTSVGTVTVVYTDATKGSVSSVTRTL